MIGVLVKSIAGHHCELGDAKIFAEFLGCRNVLLIKAERYEFPHRRNPSSHTDFDTLLYAGPICIFSVLGERIWQTVYAEYHPIMTIHFFGQALPPFTCSVAAIGSDRYRSLTQFEIPD